MDPVTPAAGTLPFPHAEVSDLVGMIIARKFVRKRGLKNLGVIYLFAVDQLPDDTTEVDPTTLPIPARAPAPLTAMDVEEALNQLLPDLEALKAIGEAPPVPEGAAAGIFGGFDWKSLLAKLLPLIITLLG